MDSPVTLYAILNDSTPNRAESFLANEADNMLSNRLQGVFPFLFECSKNNNSEGIL